MAKKSFLMLLTALLVTFAFVLVIRFYRPETRTIVDIREFPMQKDGWDAKPFELSSTVLELLRPDAIFSALYTDQQGEQIDLFFSYFAPENTEGGVHSPRNCMPGSGWQIVKSEDRTVTVRDRTIPAARLWVKWGATTRIVDFWYVTRHGETANDYKLKLFQMFSALTFQPTDVAFVRFISDGDPAGIAAMERFQQAFGPEIYHYLPFSRQT